MAEDDRSIPDGTVLWRRIPPEQMATDPRAPTGRRPSSGNFDDQALSAVIANECPLETLLRKHETYGVASFTVGFVREIGYGVIRVPDEELPGHIHITGKKTDGRSRALARRCSMVRYPMPPSKTPNNR